MDSYVMQVGYKIVKYSTVYNIKTYFFLPWSLFHRFGEYGLTKMGKHWR